MKDIDNDYIDEAIEDLIKVLGVKVEDYSFAPFTKLIRSGKIEEFVQLVAECLRLPIKINLSYVSDKYDPLEESKFESSQLTKTDHAGKGIGGITAQVYIPTYLPLFGSPGLENLPIKVKISKNCAKYPYTFIAVIAHELSHILLTSLGYKQKSNEIHTDLTPMILGFSSIVKLGRITVESKTETTYLIFSTSTRTNTKTTTYGYLTDEQFDFALDKITSIQNKLTIYKNKALKKAVSYKKSVLHYERLYYIFNKYLEYVDNHIEQKIDKNHGNTIIQLHQQLYKDNIETEIKLNKNKLKNLDGKIKRLSNSTMFMSNLESTDKELEEARSIIQPKIKQCKDDLNILKSMLVFFTGSNYI